MSVIFNAGAAGQFLAPDTDSQSPTFGALIPTSFLLSGNFSSVLRIRLANFDTQQQYIVSDSTDNRVYYQGNRTTPRARSELVGSTFNANFDDSAGPNFPQDGQIIRFETSRQDGVVTFNVYFDDSTTPIDGQSYGRLGDVIFTGLSGTSEFLSWVLVSDTETHTFDFNGSSTDTSVSSSTSDYVIALTGDYVIDNDSTPINPTIINPLYTDLSTTLATMDSRSFVVPDRTMVDDASGLFFDYRHRIDNESKAYLITGDISRLNKSLSMSDHVLQLRDDNYSAAGNNPFLPGEVEYRKGPSPFRGTTNPPPAYSHSYIDTENGVNPEVVGRTIDLLHTSRIVDALAEIVYAIYTTNPQGSFVAVAGSSTTLVAGTYAEIALYLMQEINKMLNVFEEQWSEDYIGRIGPSSTGSNWEASGYTFANRINVSSSNSVDSDNFRAWNHNAGMVKAALIINHFGGYQPNALSRFYKYVNFHKSIYELTNPGLSNITAPSLGPQTNGSVVWNYVAHRTLSEDGDHAEITISLYEVAHRLGLLQPTDIDPLYQAIEGFYQPSVFDAVYDRMNDPAEGNFGSATFGTRIIGRANWYTPQNTNLVNYFIETMNATRPSGTLGNREESSVLATHATNQVPSLNYTEINFNGTIPDPAQNESFYELILERHGVSLSSVTNDQVFVSTLPGSTFNDDTTFTLSPETLSGFYYYVIDGTPSDVYQFGVQDFTSTPQTTVVTAGQTFVIGQNSTIAAARAPVDVNNPSGASNASSVVTTGDTPTGFSIGNSLFTISASGVITKTSNNPITPQTYTVSVTPDGGTPEDVSIVVLPAPVLNSQASFDFVLSSINQNEVLNVDISNVTSATVFNPFFSYTSGTSLDFSPTANQARSYASSVNFYNGDTQLGNVTTVNVTVTVTDDVIPVITLIGDNPDTLQVGESYTDPGATFTDNTGETGVATAINAISGLVIGEETITYTATDAGGNTATATRTVNVVQGVPGGEVPGEGTDGPSSIYSSVNLPVEENDYFYAEVNGTVPDGLIFNIDGSFTWSGLSSGVHEFSVNVYKNGEFHTSGNVRVVVE